MLANGWPSSRMDWGAIPTPESASVTSTLPRESETATSSRPPFGHGLERVEQQVQVDLSQRFSIEWNLGFMRALGAVDLDLAGGHLAFEQRQGRVQRGHGVAAIAAFGGPRELQIAADRARQPVGLLDDVVRHAPGVGRQLRQSLGRAADDGERVLDLVRERGP